MELDQLDLGGAIRVLLEFVSPDLAPDGSGFSEPISSEGRARIWSPLPNNVRQPLTPHFPASQEQEETFHRPHDLNKIKADPDNEKIGAEKAETRAKALPSPLPSPERYTVFTKSYRAVSRPFHLKGQRRSESATLVE